MPFRIIILLLFSSLYSISIHAQVDTEFWFAAPEVTSSHADRPIYLRISTLQNAATITLSQPANSTFVTIEQTIAANSTLSIDLSSFIDQLENKPPNTILNYGILLKSTSPITAYYEVLGTNFWAVGANSDIFTLKGSHALGNEFYIPFQTHWDNREFIDAFASFDIVATENNTTVTITPTKELLGGHLAGVSYSIILQKGETYSAQSASILGIEHPTGSHVTSNKPIAITTKDDSILEDNSYDLAGDQLIPISAIGKLYIALKVSDAYNSDRLYIVATKAATAIYIDGNSIPIATLNAGQTFEYQLLTPSSYINASEPIYVWHVAGFGKELGGAILPSIGCSGSRQASFTRSTNEPFYLNIIVKSGYEQYFEINGNNALIPTSAFSPVIGSGGDWVYAHLTLDSLTIPSNSSNLIKNNFSDFQLATLNGTNQSGFRYGYFSDYGFLDLGTNRGMCEGDNILLDAGFLRDSYLWNTGATGQYINVSDTGFYSVEISKDTCSSKDSVHIFFYPKITTTVLGSDFEICADSLIRIETRSPFYAYLWNTGSKENAIMPNTSGAYSILVKNIEGCSKGDTINVTINPLPIPGISYNSDIESYCKNAIVALQSTPSDYERYLWSTGDTLSSILTAHNENDYYSLEVYDKNGCKNIASLELDCSPIIGLVPNLLTPNGDDRNEYFYIEYLRSGTWTFEIYNRWGQRVYKNDGYDNSFDAKSLEDGIYYYSFRHNKGKGLKKGWLEIIR